jgi:carbon-monoxide dehydrogenase medium subunit
VPLLNMRLATPKVLVDINRLDGGLGTVSTVREPDLDRWQVRVGALVRHARLADGRTAPRAQIDEHLPAKDPEPARDLDRLPLLAEASRYVAHPTIRNRGTTVGSLVHADPAAELPAVLLLCGGVMELVSVSGIRTVPAAEFFVGPLESSIQPGELAVAAVFAVPPPRSGSAFVEISRRAGDYALAGAALTVTLGPDGLISAARAAYISVGPTPVLVDLTDAVSGSSVDWRSAASLARSCVEPDDDIHATADYRRHLVGVLTKRAGAVALNRARETADAFES